MITTTDTSCLYLRLLFMTNVEVLDHHQDNLGWFRESLLKDGMEAHHEWRKKTLRGFTRDSPPPQPLHQPKYPHALISPYSAYLFSSSTLFSQTHKMSCPHRIVTPYRNFAFFWLSIKTKASDDFGSRSEWLESMRYWPRKSQCKGMPLRLYLWIPGATPCLYLLGCTRLRPEHPPGRWSFSSLYHCASPQSLEVLWM